MTSAGKDWSAANHFAGISALGPDFAFSFSYQAVYSCIETGLTPADYGRNGKTRQKIGSGCAQMAQMDECDWEGKFLQKVCCKSLSLRDSSSRSDHTRTHDSASLYVQECLQENDCFERRATTAPFLSSLRSRF